MTKANEEFFFKIQKANKEGYAGITTNGHLVDRRENPMAYPIQENKLFGVAKPKKIIWEKGDLIDTVDAYDKGFSMTLEDEDGYKYEGVGYYSCEELVSIEIQEKSEQPLPVELRTIKL